jgi:hypothetical protein
VSRADDIRRELALIEELKQLEGGEPEADEVAEGEQLIMLELLGEFAKQQIVQQTEDPTIDAEHFGLAAVLTRPMVETLESNGWKDPCPRDWHLSPETLKPKPVKASPLLRARGVVVDGVSRETPRVTRTRAGLVKVNGNGHNGVPASLADQVHVEVQPPNLEQLVAREVARIQAETLAGQRVLVGDDDTPPELRSVAPAYPPKVKKPKKKKKVAEEDVPRFYSNGQPVIADADIPLVQPESTAPAPPVQVGWVEGPDGRLQPPPRKAVKAVYPPVRGKGRPPRALALGGLTTGDDWVRDPSSGRKVPRDQLDKG